MKNKLRTFILFYSPLIFIVTDIIIGSSQVKAIPVIIQASILSIILFLTLKNFTIKKDIIFKVFIFLCFVMIISSFFSSDQILTLNMFIKFSFSFFYLFIANSLTENLNDLLKIIKVNIFGTFGVYIYYLYCTIFNIGQTIYSNQILKIGYHNYSNQFVFPILFIAIIYFREFIERKYFYIFYLISTLIVLILSFRRTNLLILAFGLIFLIFYSNKKIRFNIIFYLLIIFFISLPFWGKIVNEINWNLKQRERIAYIENYYEEGRFTENLLIFAKLSNDPIKLIFGSGELFNSEGKYDLRGEGEWDWNRPIHNDYGNIFWGLGLFGLLIYLYLFFLIFIKLSKNDRFIKPFSYYIFLVFFFVGFSSGMFDVYYRIFITSLIGTLIKLANNK